MLRILKRPFGYLQVLHSLQWQLAASYAAMAALLCTAMGLMVMQGLSHVLLEQDGHEVAHRAEVAGDILYRDLSLNRPLPVLLAEASQAARARVCVIGPEGGTLGCSIEGLNIPPGVSPELSIDSGVSRVTSPIRQFTNALTGFQTSNVLGSVTIDEPLTYRHWIQQRVQAAIVQLSLIATAIAAGVGLLLGRGLTAPLRALTEAARRLGSGNLNARAPQDGDDEIGELGAGFNRMASQLQDSFATLESERDALRTFIADMSHELRTPITALRTFNDLLSQGAVADETVRDEFLNESALQVDRLEWLAHNLLDLSKFDAGLADMRLQHVDLTPLVQRAVEEARLAADQKQVAVRFDRPAIGVPAQADPARIQQALSNILGNAVKFTPGGGTVSVSLQREGRSATIAVRDTGPGIAADELPHVFERFYRGPSTAVMVGGSGLGLPIVQSIMHAHGGDVEIRSQQGHGTEVTLTLPAA